MKANGNHLRKRLRKMMIDADMGQGAIKDLAKSLGMNSNSLNMALTGYRTGPRSLEMLLEVKRHLEKKKNCNK
jgi:hypothetical protein